MISQGDLQLLLDSLGHSSWGEVAGYGVIVLVSVLRALSGRAGPLTAEWLSALSALLGGLGVALASGGTWWHASLLALVAAPTSRGFWSLVARSLPMLPVLALVLLVECAEPVACRKAIITSISAVASAITICMDDDSEGVFDETLNRAVGSEEPRAARSVRTCPPPR